MLRCVSTALAATLLCATAAPAAIFDFSYELASGDILAGSLDGALQGDGDTIIVSSILDVTLARRRRL